MCPHDSQGVMKERCMRNLESAVEPFPGMNLLSSRFTETGKSGRFWQNSWWCSYRESLRFISVLVSPSALHLSDRIFRPFYHSTFSYSIIRFIFLTNGILWKYWNVLIKPMASLSLFKKIYRHSHTLLYIYIHSL